METTDLDRLADMLFEKLKEHLSRTNTSVESKQTLAEWLVLYKDILKDRSYNKQTLKNRNSNLIHVNAMWGGYPLRELKPHIVASKLKESFANRAALHGRVLAEMKDVCCEAVNNGWLDSNPAQYLKAPFSSVLRKRLTLETWVTMTELAKAHNQAWVLPMLNLALITGQRRADLAKMKFEDIWDDHLHIEQQKKAGKPQGSRVALPLSLRLNVINLRLRDVIVSCLDYSTYGPTLLRKASGKTLELSSLSTRFGELIREAHSGSGFNINEWPSLHEVRSLSERLYRAQGVNTQRLLGHKTQEMTDLYNDDRGLTANEWKAVVLTE